MFALIPSGPSDVPHLPYAELDIRDQLSQMQAQSSHVRQDIRLAYYSVLMPTLHLQASGIDRVYSDSRCTTTAIHILVNVGSNVRLFLVDCLMA